MKGLVYLLIFTCSVASFAQDTSSNYRTKRVAVKDTIVIDTVSINPANFKVSTLSQTVIDTALFNINFSKALLTLKQPLKVDSLNISYLRYPNFLTKVYQQLDEKIIVDKSKGLSGLYQINDNTRRPDFTPFDGLTTSGSISRGVTIGNNQNSVLNSELDLQISGQLSEKVALRASIQDANIPLQESGYSQRLDEFDQVFIEVLSDQWNIRAGDIDLQNTQSYFANFSKRVQGLLVNANLSEKTSVFASGALVRGQFTTTQFVAQEGNQGPYKLRGPNGELYVLVVSGSETVYVNGVPLKRGENYDYIIDYNAGEIIFNSTFPITSEMRITVDYQFSERNYSRFTVYGGAQYHTEKLKLNVSIYSESDAKNQPLQQNLSAEQVEILSNAGDDTSAMVAPSASAQEFSENRILYRKEIVNGEEIFVFSTNPEDELFSVQFTLVGDNQGNYILSNDNAVSNIYEYVAPIAGVPQGNYSPIIRLVAPERLQIAVLNGEYSPSDDTSIFFELAGSKNDLNLFSNLDNDNNDGFATKLKITQQIFKQDSSWQLSATADTDYIQENFRTIQRAYRPEFNRDWNLGNATTDQGNINFDNQLLFVSGLQLKHHQKGLISYNFEHLNFSKTFNGNRHNLFANLHWGHFHLFSKSSYLKGNGDSSTSTFARSFNRVVYGTLKKWAGAKMSFEDNEQRIITSDSLTPLSQKFQAYEAFVGIGDSTRVFTEVGYIKRLNDSLRNNRVQSVNSSNTFYLKSRLIQNTKTNLQVFINYRDLKFEDSDQEDEESINSRINFSQRLFNNVLLYNASYETNSGTLAQQDFTFVEVEPGQGAYTWIDYNENGIQELDEFEIAQFQDEGNFIRVLLPNQTFVRTHQNRLSQSLTFNPQSWQTATSRFKQFVAQFYNQTSYLIDRKTRREGNNFTLNPFKTDEANALGINTNFRNVLFFNRGKQRYTTSYTFLSNTNRNLLSIGFQENAITTHQLNFNHKFKTSWLINILASTTDDESTTENFVNRNYRIEELRYLPKLSYLFSQNAQFDVFYQFTSKENSIGNLETLKQNNFGLSFTYNSAQKVALTGEINYFDNKFEGSANTPVAYQMLEGLQPGKNFTWSLLAQKKLTKFLDLNLNYLGRKTASSRTIHTGTIQLKAYF